MYKHKANVMPFTNLNSKHLTPEKFQEAKDAIAALENAVSEIAVNLTPKERWRYGRVNEQNKLFVNKVYDYRQSQPQLSVTDIDWAEFEKDYESRAVCESLLNRLAAVALTIRNAKIMHDYDNYQVALRDYNFTKYHAANGTPGFETKKRELKEFFPRSNRKKSSGDGQPTERSE